CSSSAAMGHWFFTIRLRIPFEVKSSTCGASSDTENVVMAGKRPSHFGAAARISSHPAYCLSTAGQAFSGSSSSLERVVEPAVIDPDPSVLRGAHDIHIAMPEANFGMLVGFSRVD